MADNESSDHLRAPACRQRTRMTEDDDTTAKDSTVALPSSQRRSLPDPGRHCWTRARGSDDEAVTTMTYRKITRTKAS
jgi:hypothetical protein